MICNNKTARKHSGLDLPKTRDHRESSSRKIRNRPHLIESDKEKLSFRVEKVNEKERQQALTDREEKVDMFAPISLQQER
jgi:hypothetical protein